MYGPTLPLDWMQQEFEHLSKRIILLKILYYCPEIRLSKRAQKLAAHDDVYDNFEKGYLRLCRELSCPNTLVHKEYPDYRDVVGDGMMEVDLTRKDVQAVLLKYKP